jgi:pyrroloquinoline quinone biosynthesis protein E
MSEAPRPYTLVAELTYRCPLRCVYCSNPLDYGRHRDELDTETWLRVLREAEDLGVVQLNLTGGEPLVRDDLEDIIAEARRLDLYTNLITSGIPLRRERLARFRELGLDNVQISIQDTEAAGSDRIAGRRSFDGKLVIAGWVKELGFPLTLNTVLHRENLDHVADVVALAERLGTDRLELANTQYLGWALPNRAALLPTQAQLARAREIAGEARRRLRGPMEVLFVTPDYYTDLPKACMDGWGRRFIVVSPDGLVLPCHAAHTLPGLRFDSVKDRPLREIWLDSPGFNAFRGESWMPEPCRSCERREIDFGGCRCQAFHLTGNAAATDPTWPYRGPLATAGVESLRDGPFRKDRAAWRVEFGNEGWNFAAFDPGTTTLDYIEGTNNSGTNTGGPGGKPGAVSSREPLAWYM